MSDAFDTFLRTTAKRSLTAAWRGPAGPEVAVCAFGKHPLKDDHTPHWGDNTELLSSIRELIYISGVGTLLNTGAWLTEDEAKARKAHQTGKRYLKPEDIIDYAHAFLWTRNDVHVLGRLWKSVDATGTRDKYPMVICAEIRGMPAEAALHAAWAALENLQKQTIEARDESVIQAALFSCKDEIKRRLSQTPLAVDHGAVLLRAPVWQTAPEAFERVAYEIAEFFKDYSNPKLVGRDGGKNNRSTQLRVPRALEEAGTGLSGWHALVRKYVLPEAPVLLMAAMEHPWIDITVGEAGPLDFFSLKAGSKHVPLASEVSHDIDDKTRAFAAQLKEAFGVQTAASAPAFAIVTPAPLFVAPDRTPRLDVPAPDRKTPVAAAVTPESRPLPPNPVKAVSAPIAPALIAPASPARNVIAEETEIDSSKMATSLPPRKGSFVPWVGVAAVLALVAFFVLRPKDEVKTASAAPTPTNSASSRPPSLAAQTKGIERPTNLPAAAPLPSNGVAAQSAVQTVPPPIERLTAQNPAPGTTVVANIIETKTAAPTPKPAPKAEDRTEQAAFRQPLQIKLNVSGIEGGAPTVSLVSSNLGLGTLRAVDKLTFEYVATNRGGGTDSFAYQVTHGAQTSRVASVKIEVARRPNAAPVAIPLKTETSLNKPLSLTLKGSDGDGDPLTYRLVGEKTHEGGTLTPGATAREMVFKPATDWHGTNRFSFEVHDGETSSAPAKIEIVVVPPPFEAIDLPLETEGTTEVKGSLPKLPNVYVPSTAVIVSEPQFGKAGVAGDFVSYAASEISPTNRQDSFQYLFSRDGRKSSTGTVTVEIKGVADQFAGYPLSFTNSRGMIFLRLTNSEVLIQGKPLYVAECETTITQFEFRESTHRSELPKVSIGTNQCNEFSKKLDSELKESPAARLLTEKNYRYRLPTVREWKVFSAGAFTQKSTNYIVTKSMAHQTPAIGTILSPVKGQRQKSLYGLYDVVGNAWELSADGMRMGCNVAGEIETEARFIRTISTRGPEPYDGFRLVLSP